LALTIITFPYRIDRWDDGNSVPEHLADIDHLIVARAIYEAACKRWPGRRITSRPPPPCHRPEAVERRGSDRLAAY
jgi:hypothetical protein